MKKTLRNSRENSTRGVYIRLVIVLFVLSAMNTSVHYGSRPGARFTDTFVKCYPKIYLTTKIAMS